jgi:hypothetical protein
MLVLQKTDVWSETPFLRLQPFLKKSFFLFSYLPTINKSCSSPLGVELQERQGRDRTSLGTEERPLGVKVGYGYREQNLTKKSEPTRENNIILFESCSKSIELEGLALYTDKVV